MYGVAEKLNIQNFVNSTANYVDYTYGISGSTEKLNT